MTKPKDLEKWCPMVRFVRDEDGLLFSNRGHGADNLQYGFRCLGSGCMAWRVIEGIDGNEGYCGLAGQP